MALPLIPLAVGAGSFGLAGGIGYGAGQAVGVVLRIAGVLALGYAAHTVIKASSS